VLLLLPQPYLTDSYLEPNRSRSARTILPLVRFAQEANAVSLACEVEPRRIASRAASGERRAEFVSLDSTLSLMPKLQVACPFRSPPHAAPTRERVARARCRPLCPRVILVWPRRFFRGTPAPSTWAGWRNPVHYTSLEKLGINPEQLVLRPMP
jgi:hypothetical protein